MTSRERIAAALSHREPDRTPIFEYVLLSPLADLLLGRLYGGDPANWSALVDQLGWEEAVRRNAADRVDLAVLLGHDMIYASPDECVYSPKKCGLHASSRILVAVAVPSVQSLTT